MKIKTSELIGRPLDHAVAIALGGTDLWFDTVGTCWITIDGEDRALSRGLSAAQNFSPSIDWAEAGPIIDEEDIQWCKLNGQIEAWSGFNYIEWRQNWDSSVCMGEGSGFGTGPTILIAAMRCYCCAKLGDEIEIPQELQPCQQPKT